MRVIPMREQSRGKEAIIGKTVQNILVCGLIINVTGKEPKVGTVVSTRVNGYRTISTVTGL